LNLTVQYRAPVEEQVVLGELVACRLDPYFHENEVQSGDREHESLFDAYDSNDQDTHELWCAIYEEDGIDFRAPWAKLIDCASGPVLVLDCVVDTEFEGSWDWIEPLAIQAMLDQAEQGVNMTLVDLRRLKPEYLKSRLALFKKFGFRRPGKQDFMVRDPACRHPRVRLAIPDRDETEPAPAHGT